MFLAKPAVCAFYIAFLCACAPLHAATLGSQTVTLSATPTALACIPQRYVNRLTVRVIPGFEGKVFVGISGMNPAIYSGALSILYPNLGAHSEEYTVRDPSGDDGIDLCGIHIAGEIPGEAAIAEFASDGNGTAAPNYLLVPNFVAPLSSDGICLCSGTTIVRAQMIPGNEGKQTVAFSSAPLTDPSQLTPSNQVAVLYPNTGDITQHSGWSEAWEQTDPLGNNGLSAGGGYFTFFPEIPGEQILVSTWQKQAAAGTAESATVSWTFNAATLSNSGPSGSSQIPNLYDINDLKIRQIPGYDSKLYVGDCLAPINDGAGNVYKILYPNNTGSLGFSEVFGFGPGRAAESLACYGSDDAASFAVSYLVPSGPLPAALDFAANQTAATLVPDPAGTPINRGNVKHLAISVTPGLEGKMYIGSANMNISTLDGVYAILFPNAIGRWSESLELDDPEGHGIPTNTFYIQSEIPGESVMVASVASGVTPPDGALSVKASGALSGSYSSYAMPFAASSTPAAFLRAQAIPGGDGKLWIGTAAMTAAQPDGNYTNVLKVLWPSQGDYDIGEGHSEKFIQTCSAGPVSASNCIDLANYTFWPYVMSEQLLVFALGR